MHLSRRGFMGALSGVVASGPKAVVKLADPVGIPATVLKGLDMREGRVDYPPDYPSEDNSWATKRLAKWLLPGYRDRKFREFSVDALHPDLYALRSMSLSAKMRIQKRRDFEIYEKKDQSYLRRYIAGEYK